MTVLAAGIAFLTMTSACGPDTITSRDGVIVRDSAGVWIVENGGDPFVDVARISAEPVLQIGEADGRPAYQLFRVRAVSLLSTGHVAVMNTGTGEVRVFDNRGRFVGWSGGMGEGPGEYLTMGSMRRVAGDSLHITDPRAARITVVGPDGRYVRDFRPPFDELPAGIVEVLADLGAILRRSANHPDRSAEMHHDTVLFQLLPPRGEPVDLGRFAGEESRIGIVEFQGVRGFSKVDIPFAHAVHLAVSDTLVYVGSNVNWDIHQFDGRGRLLRIIRSAHATPREVTREMLEHYARAEIEARGAEATPSLIRMNMPRLERLPRVSGTPVHDRMLVAATGELWVKEYPLPSRKSERWTLFSPEGLLMGGVDLPLRFEPYHVAGGLVAGVYRDPLGVEYVRVYRLEVPR